MMMVRCLAAAGASALILAANPVAAVAQTAPPPDRLASFADIADHVLAAPLIVRASIARTAPQRAAGAAPPGRVRLAVTAMVSNPLLAPGPIGASLAFLWDAPAERRGRPPTFKGMEILAFLAPGAGPGTARLISARAVQPWDPALADQVRTILADDRSGAVPIITGVSNGFRADGTVPGESESQFFLTSRDNRPVTLVVQNRPGEVRRVAVARGDIIDESAQRVQPGTLLWYRLACFLPASLPVAAGGDDPALARDWRDALASLGPCGRTG
ncbi:MAG: hypothetical protein KGQ52_07535 [Alphaproteobacteria bacterium]|nr:hypothetical protein [Alphaproteobacteria bacterium]